MVLQYFAQDEATRLDPSPTVYETLASGSLANMMHAIRNILGGFLFSGDDVHKKVRVLSGGERTRLAVARMLLRPSNTLLLDEPTNHLDLDSKEVLLDALVDYGGTLIFVSHDRYFVERLATRIIEVGHGDAIVYPGTYREFLWHKEHGEAADASERQVSGPKVAPAPGGRPASKQSEAGRSASASKSAGTPVPPVPGPAQSREEKKRVDAETRRKARESDARRARVSGLEARIAEVEQEIRELERAMSAEGFYVDRTKAQPVIDRHQSLMWEVGDLMHQWEELQTALDFGSVPHR